MRRRPAPLQQAVLTCFVNQMSLLPLIIVNPASAGGATGDAWPGVASAVRHHFGPFNVEFTRRGGEAVEIAEREARAGRRLVFACGGVGTISEVADGVTRHAYVAG